MSKSSKKPHNIPRFNDNRDSDLYNGTTVLTPNASKYDTEQPNSFNQRTGAEFDKPNGSNGDRTGDGLFPPKDIPKNNPDTTSSSNLSGSQFFSRILNFAMWSTGVSVFIVVGLVVLSIFLPTEKNTIINSWTEKFFDITKFLIGAIIGLLGGRHASKE